MFFTFYLKDARCSDGSKINTSVELPFEQLVSIVSPSKLCKILNASCFVYEGDKPIRFTRKNIAFVNVHSFLDLGSGHSSKEPKKD